MNKYYTDALPGELGNHNVGIYRFKNDVEAQAYDWDTKKWQECPSLYEVWVGDWTLEDITEEQAFAEIARRNSAPDS